MQMQRSDEARTSKAARHPDNLSIVLVSVISLHAHMQPRPAPRADTSNTTNGTTLLQVRNFGRNGIMARIMRLELLDEAGQSLGSVRVLVSRRRYAKPGGVWVLVFGVWGLGVRELRRKRRKEAVQSPGCVRVLRRARRHPTPAGLFKQFNKDAGD